MNEGANHCMTTDFDKQPALSADDIDHFIRQGYVVVRDCFSKADADPIIAAALKEVKR